jgi:hypothetical protein
MTSFVMRVRLAGDTLVVENMLLVVEHSPKFALLFSPVLLNCTRADEVRCSECSRCSRGFSWAVFTVLVDFPTVFLFLFLIEFS